MLTLCAIAAAMALGAAPAAAANQVFGFTGTEQSFVVPGGVHFLSVRLAGGHGGPAGGTGGAAAEVAGSLEVEPGETLYVEVGGNGENAVEGGEGGFNGGGNGAGGGGGASDIRLVPRLESLSLESRLIIAAGGGGGGGNGGEAGANGGEAGSPGDTSSGGNGGGGAGTGSEGGGGGSGCGGSGGAGELGAGGAGGSGEGGTNGGGGGGGGLYGGGGGSGGCSLGGGGGGGGSSFIPGFGLELTAVGPPKVEISYKKPPLINIISPAGGATFTLGQGVAASYSCTPQEGTSLEFCIGSVASGASIDTSTPGQHSFTVEAEDNTGGTNSQTVKYTVLSPAPNPPPPGPSVPDTVLGSHPSKKIKTTKKKVKVRFTFSASVAGATFQCKLDKGAFAPCASPKTYKVKAGKHKFSVAAASGGLVDSTPATFSFKVIHLR
ncbi:MAG TPA: hypothetical protein VFS64_03170 [Solirubrobacterales bacterium]|nr:hypothetical protein [Solirubrobacterales bacterium]